MYDTSGRHSICDAAPLDADTRMRLDWLGAQVALVEDPKAAAFRREWELWHAMSRPVTTEKAYARFGFCLGLFPPFAIFARIILNSGRPYGDLFSVILLFGVMNLICCVTGWKFAEYQGRKIGDPRGREWSEHVGGAFSMAMLWALVAGGSGGFVVFGIGSVAGAFCAFPVALVTFPVFAVLHRVHSHGGMIEARDLRPLAQGIPLAAAALILFWK